MRVTSTKLSADVGGIIKCGMQFTSILIFVSWCNILPKKRGFWYKWVPIIWENGAKYLALIRQYKKPHINLYQEQILLIRVPLTSDKDKHTLYILRDILEKIHEQRHQITLYQV